MNNDPKYQYDWLKLTANVIGVIEFMMYLKS